MEKRVKLKTPFYILSTIVLLAVLLISIVLSVSFGTVKIPLSEVYGVIIYKLTGIGDATFGEGRIHDVVWLIRLPRILLALTVGMTLAVCGLVMQAIVKNPLADPYIMGVSSGAYAGVTAALMLGAGSALGANFIGIMGFAGAFAAAITVMLLANLGGKANSIKLILAGTAVSTICSAFSNFVVYFNNESQRLQELVSWNMGSLGRVKWETLPIVFIVAAAGTAFFLTQHRKLNLMLLGDDAAITLGTELHRWRIGYLLVSSLMIGFAVFAAGMIGFVGLVIPHIVRIFFGVDHKKLVGICALSGSVFLIWADVLCRTIVEGVELPIGILTSMIGAPCFIYLMVRRQYGFGGAGK